ncbi:MAG: nuclear transport factor 2 family protein [Gaiellaceae bacterium]
MAESANVAAVLDAYRLAKRSDHAALRPRIADDATWHPAKEGAWNPCRNADQIVRTLLWRTHANRMRPGEVIDLGDRVLLQIKGVRLGQLGGRGFHPRLYQIVVVRNGKIVSMRDYRSREEAHAAAGLRA